MQALSTSRRRPGPHLAGFPAERCTSRVRHHRRSSGSRRPTARCDPRVGRHQRRRRNTHGAACARCTIRRTDARGVHARRHRGRRRAGGPAARSRGRSRTTGTSGRVGLVVNVDRHRGGARRCATRPRPRRAVQRGRLEQFADPYQGPVLKTLLDAPVAAGTVRTSGWLEKVLASPARQAVTDYRRFLRTTAEEICRTSRAVLDTAGAGSGWPRRPSPGTGASP